MRMYRLFQGLLGPMLLLLVQDPSPAQITFEKTYGGISSDRGYFVQQTQDGGYIIAGETQSYGVGNYDACLVKTDSLGNALWLRAYGGINWDTGWFVQQTQDGGYIIAGSTESFGAGLNDVYVIKTDSLSDTVWTRTYGGIVTDRGFSIRQTQDGGYIIAGYAESFGAGSLDVYLIKTDSAGDSMWTRTYGGSSPDYGQWVQQTPDGGYIIGGWTWSFGLGFNDVYLVKTDSAGDSLWTRTYGGVSADWGQSVQQTRDGGYIIAGGTSSFGAGGDDFYLVRTDSSGDSVWTRTYGGGSDDYAQSIQETEDGGYIVTGWTESFGAGSSDAYFLKIDSSGDSVWARSYGGISSDCGYSVQQTRDGGYVIAGETWSLGAGQNDIYLIKTSPNGTLEWPDGGVASIDAPPDTVFTDSVYAIQATVRNSGNLLETFDVIASIDGYTDTVQVADLAPDSTVQVTFGSWQVPPTDSVTYTMTVCTELVGDVDTTNDCMEKTVFAYNPTGVEEGYDRPVAVDFRLWENAPNPLHHSTVISYSLPHASRVTLAIYDITGRLVQTLVNETQRPGIHQAQWNRKGNPSGVYFYRLRACPEQSPESTEGLSGEPVEPQSRRAGEFVETRKMVVVE